MLKIKSKKQMKRSEIPDEEIKEVKKALREKAHKTLEALCDPKNSKSIQERTQAAIAKLKKTSEYKNAKTILIYSPIKGEVDISSLLELANDTEDDKPQKDKKTWVLPRTLGKGVMVFFEIKNFDGLIEGKHGIKEPPGNSKFVDKNDIDLAIVPGLMFDKQGHRLGHGGGYFDRLLGENDIKSIGICFKEQLSDDLPAEEHDIKVDFILEV